MPSREPDTPRDNYSLLTHVEATAPLGQFLRRYWIPAALSEEIPERGGAPVRVGLLGEKLVAFRDPNGVVGLVEEFCPHRRASLLYGRNEPGGIRCIYHGWKMAPDGCILETPAEPADSKLKEHYRHVAYPVREAGGIVWTYMGPKELEPPFPKFPWLDLPSSQLLVVKMYQDNNFLQGLEGDLDPAHPNYLHRDLEEVADKSWAGVGWKSMSTVMTDEAPAIHCEETPYLMRIGAVRRTADPKVNYVRRYEWIAPFYAYIPTGPQESRLFKAWHPIDNESCFTFYIHYDLVRPLDIPAIYANWGHRTEKPHYRTAHANANQHLQDRRRMMVENYSGVDGAAIQDRAVQESMGPIVDRSKEHLGTSDKAVVFYRRLLLRKMQEMQEGKPLPGHDPSLDYDQRGASFAIPADRPWQDVVALQDAYERENPVGVAAE